MTTNPRTSTRAAGFALVGLFLLMSLAPGVAAMTSAPEPERDPAHSAIDARTLADRLQVLEDPVEAAFLAAHMTRHSEAGEPDISAMAANAWNAAIRTALDPLSQNPDHLTMAAGVPGRDPGAEIGYRMPYPTCDVDGDGLQDVVVDRLQPFSATSPTPAMARIEMRSGADGTVLWNVDDLDHQWDSMGTFGLDLRPEAGYRIGDQLPTIDDTNADGVCEILAWQADGEDYVSVPQLLPWAPSMGVRNMTFSLRALDGTTGDPTWIRSFHGSYAYLDDRTVGSRQVSRIENLVTGLMTLEDEVGSLAVVKTTNVTRIFTTDPWLARFVPITDGQMEFLDQTAEERLHLVDLRDGSIIWTYVLPDTSDQGFVSSRQLGATLDVTNDGKPDIILEDHWIPNPVADEIYAPITGDTAARPNEGLALTVIDGARDGVPSVVWTKPVVAEPPAETTMANEESVEALVWAHSQALPDIDGDGTSDIGFRYLILEQGMPTSTVGAYQTHVVPISGADGSFLWDTKMQGWSVIGPVQETAGGQRMAILSADVISPGGQSGSVVTGFAAGVRFAQVEALTGEPVWSEEHPYALGGGLPYTMAIATALAGGNTIDVDQDGLLDLVSPPRADTLFSPIQRLASSQMTAFDVRSAVDGKPLSSMTVAGATGRVLPCSDDGALTLLSFTGRRVEITRIDPVAETVLWSKGVFADTTPRSSHFRPMITNVYVNCALVDGGSSLLYGLDLGRESSDRGSEMLSIMSITDARTGDDRWRFPDRDVSFAENFAVPARVQTTEATLQERAMPLLIAAAGGLLLGLIGVPIVRRFRNRDRGLAGFATIGILLLIVAAPIGTALNVDQDLAETGSLQTPALDNAEPQPSKATPEQHRAVPISPQAHPYQSPVGQTAAEEIPELNRLFRQDVAATYAYPIGDVNEDGVEDVALHYSCLYYLHLDCLVGLSGNGFDPQFWIDYLTIYSGQPFLKLVGISGADGEILWSVDMDHGGSPPPAIFHSVNEYTIGTLEMESGETGVLVYRWDEYCATFLCAKTSVTNALRLYGARDGRLVWDNNFQGARSCTIPICWSESEAGQQQIITPIIRQDAEGNDVLFVRTLSYQRLVDDPSLHLAEGFVGMPHVQVLDQYLARDELVRVDIETGNEMWRTLAIDPPIDGRSSRPVWDNAPEDMYWNDFQDVTAPQQDHFFWEEGPCCGDLTGDGIPDIAFEIYEWSSTPNIALNGPYALTGRVGAIDGATGDRLFDVTSIADADVRVNRPYANTLQSELGMDLAKLGDVNGDGAEEFVVRTTVINKGAHYEEFEVRNGPDGALLWQHVMDQDGAFRPIADVDGDGGTDILEIRWFADDTMQQLMPRAHDLVLRSGATGEVIRTHESTTAPFDIAFRFDEPRTGAYIDIDQDGRSEVLLDDPMVWPDGTLVHRNQLVDAASGELLWEQPAVGAVSEPYQVPDLDGDDIPDIVLLSGDVIDLWLTAYSSITGEAMWSRAMTGLPNLEYYRADPRLTFDALEREDGGHDLVTTLHLYLEYRSVTWVPYLCCDEERIGETGLPREYKDHVSVVRALDGRTGEIRWSVPDPGSREAYQPIAGSTPATQVFEAWEAEERKPMTVKAAEAAAARAPVGLSFIAGLVGGIAIAMAISLYKRRDEGVPELDI